MESLKAGREALKKLWNDGLSGSPLLARQTDIVDKCINDLFGKHADAESGIAIIATGGYGRKELFPFSDIDLLILHDRKARSKLVEKVVTAILYPLWDSGMEVGHSVRTQKQCLADCKNDFHLQSSLLDLRLVAGSEMLMEKLATSYRKKFIEGRRNYFYEKMSASRIERHQKYGGHSFQLEPDIKEGRGGFRDIQTMQWTAKVLFGITGTTAMEDTGLISNDERMRLEQSTEALIRIRNRLHYLSARKNDQLFYEHQEDIAHALGIKDSPGQLAVESFMQQLYRDLQNIKIVTDLFFEHTAERTVKKRPVIKNRVVDVGLEIINDTLRFVDHGQIKDKPSLMMELFSHAAELELPIHYRSRQAVAENLDLVDKTFSNSKKNAKCFFRVLISPDPLKILSTMLETGFLRSYFPEFGNVESLALHDVYHVYTVDRHLLQTVHEVQTLSKKLPEIFSSITSIKVLLLSALLHDVGKGSGKDHSSAGAGIAHEIGKRMDLDEAELEDLRFLIKNHLFMSHTAQRRDLEDENLISQFAGHVMTTNRLNMLYLLSISDSKATGPSSWTDWKGALLQELFLKTANYMENRNETAPDLDQAAHWMREKVKQIAEIPSAVNIAKLPDEYLVNFTPSEIKDHFEMCTQLDTRKIVSAVKDHGDHWTVLVVSHDKPGLLAKICGTLALNNLTVLAAKINTWPDGTVVDQIDVRPEFNINFNEQDWLKLDTDLLKAVDNRLGFSHRLAVRGKTHSGIKPERKTSRHQSRIETDNSASDKYTVVEIYADDQPALLYNITRTLAEFELNISRAMISTRLEQLVDVFYVQDWEMKKITDPERLNEIKEALIFAIS